MLHMQNLPEDSAVECTEDIKTDEGVIRAGSRGLIKGFRHEIPHTIYKIKWSNPEPLNLSAVFTGAGGDLDEPVFTRHTHLDPILNRVCF